MAMAMVDEDPCEDVPEERDRADESVLRLAGVVPSTSCPYLACVMQPVMARDLAPRLADTSLRTRANRLDAIAKRPKMIDEVLDLPPTFPTPKSFALRLSEKTIEACLPADLIILLRSADDDATTKLR